MAAEVMTFDSLKADVRRYLERGSALDTQVFEQIPRLIGLAERTLARQLKVTGVMTVVTTTLQAGVSTYEKPDRWRRTVSMEYSRGVSPNQTREPLFPRSYEYCREYWPNVEETGEPQFYADYDYSNWLIVPTPVVDAPWQIIYYGIPPLLQDSNQTNWWTDYAPNALLYRTLVEAEPFLKNDERIGVWKALCDEAVKDINMEDLEKVVDRSAVRRGD